MTISGVERAFMWLSSLRCIFPRRLSHLSCLVLWWCSFLYIVPSFLRSISFTWFESPSIVQSDVRTGNCVRGSGRRDEGPIITGEWECHGCMLFRSASSS